MNEPTFARGRVFVSPLLKSERLLIEAGMKKRSQQYRTSHRRGPGRRAGRRDHGE